MSKLVIWLIDSEKITDLGAALEAKERLYDTFSGEGEGIADVFNIIDKDHPDYAGLQRLLKSTTEIDLLQFIEDGLIDENSHIHD